MIRLGKSRHSISIFALLLAIIPALGQEDVDFDQLLQRVDTIENPIYKPVISLSYGALNFIGDVRNSYRMPIVGNPAGKLNVTTFIDNRHFFAANFYFMTGVLTGNERSVTDISRNLNFSSNIFAIGVSARYHFGHIIPEDVLIKPYIALGFEQLNFNTDGDLEDQDGRPYHYWSDGTIRSIAEGTSGSALPLVRDYRYDTDLRSNEKINYKLGDYSTRSAAIPFEIGFRLDISDRVGVSIGTEYHFTFTDFIDNVSSEGTHIAGNRAKDAFLFTQATLHFDMFSDPTTRTVELLYADVELDPIFYADEDGDFVLDVADRCPGTPYGVVTDTTGCPLDGDGDGVPDYLDKEQDTRSGAWVDDQGITIDEDKLISRLGRGEALKREDLAAYMALYEDRFKAREVSEIPEKFAALDADEDGYISFEELLRIIDGYFDYSVDLSLEELRQVNEFFFSQ